MTDLQFTIWRFAILPIAIVAALGWLSLPFRLDVEKATEAVAMVSWGRGRGGVEFVYLDTSALGGLSFPCSDVPKLCNKAAIPRDALIRVWIQDPGYFSRHWVVAAEYDGSSVVTPSEQTNVYRTTRWVFGFGVAVLVGTAILLWCFGPFKKIDDEVFGS